MNAIELTTNFNNATSLYVAKDLYAKKRAKLGSNKRSSLDSIYDEFLANNAVTEVAAPVEEENPMDAYQSILDEHKMVSYVADIKNARATGAKKLRVGDIVRTASIKFSDAISVNRPQEVKLEIKEEPPVVEEEVKPSEEPMTRLRRHEDVDLSAIKPVPTVQIADDVTNRRLDSYLSNSLEHSTVSESEDQKFDKLAKKLSEIDELNRKANDLQSQEESLLAQEKAMDDQINEALKKADDDYFEATQSLDEVAERINQTQERMRRKKELIDRLSSM